MQKYLDFKKSKDYTKLKEIGEIIKNSGIVVFPTETVYGLGGDAYDPTAAERIFAGCWCIKTGLVVNPYKKGERKT